MPRIITNLWFDTRGEEAAEFYCSIFPNSKVTLVTRYGEGAPQPAGSVMSIDFELDGTPLTIINGGPQFTLDEACSLLIECADQAEIDRYWDALTADGGEESQCGWLKDKFGVSWQVVPSSWADVFRDPDPAKAERAMQAVFAMKKIDIAAVEAAANAAP